MRTRFSRWLNNFPVSDPIEHQQAAVFQLGLIGWIALASINLLLTYSALLLPPPPGTPPLESAPPLFLVTLVLMLLVVALLWACPVSALVVLRRGRFKRSVAVAVIGLLLTQTIATFCLGVTSTLTYSLFHIPIVLAGLLGGRRLLLSAFTISSVVIVIVTILESLSPPLAGLLYATTNADGVMVSPLAGRPIWVEVAFLIGSALVVTVLLDRFGGALRNALIRSLEREAELKVIRTSLETTVAERTAALQTALSETHARAEEQARLVEEQARLLAENARQQGLIRELSVPVIPISADALVMPLVGVLDSARLQQVQERSLQALERTSARTLVLDITGVPVVDGEVAQGFLRTVRSARLLGADVMLVGIRPEVAQALVGLGIELGEVHTFSDLQSALRRIFTRTTLASTNSQPRLRTNGAR